MKILNLVPVCLGLVLFTVCAGGRISSADQHEHGSTYSDASLNGAYALSVEGDWIQGQNFSGIGTIDFNGAGKITGGSLTDVVFVSGPSCVGTLNGTYSVSPSGSGTAQITATFSTPCVGAWSGSTSFKIEISQSGEAALIASTLPSPAFTGIALKR